MNCSQNGLSTNTQNYLSTYSCILDTMIQKMTGVDLGCSISGNFIMQMIPHHKAAIEMSQNLLKYTTNIPLERIATHIISEQTESINQMLSINEYCSQLINPQQQLCYYQNSMEDIMDAMFCRMKNARISNNIDYNFIQEMIPHHAGAVQMSELTLQNNICSELVPILQAIITSQKRGITQMQQLLRCIKP